MAADNKVMYPLIFLVPGVSVAANLLVGVREKRILSRGD